VKLVTVLLEIHLKIKERIVSMAKERTEKSKYPSRYSLNGWVTAAQWIVEFISEKKAKQEKKELPVQFWKLPEWNKFYRSQIHTANALVKKHGELAVIAALKHKDSWWMHSLRAPGFDAIILQERRNLLAKAPKEPTENYDSIDTTAKPPVDFSSAKLADKLRDL
jgi:hypothetical protein